MESKKLKLNFEMQISDVVDLNKSFARGKCLVCYTGRNRNLSDIGKQKIIDALPSMKNIPVVGRFDTDKEDFGGHDIKVINKDDGIDIVNATVPFGLVPESAEQWFETSIIDGEEKECLFTDIILWKRQHGYEKIANSEKIPESMEIDVQEYIIDQDGYFVIDKFQFEALCLLGEDVEPCFENACVQAYSKEIVSDFKLQFSEMLKEFKDLDQHSDDNNPVTEEFDIKNENNNGGNQVSKKEEIAKKFGKVISELDFSVDDMTDEEFENKMEELFGEKNEPETMSFSATYNQKRDALREALSSLNNVVRDDDRRCVEDTYYYLTDFDDNYVFVEVDHWTAENYDCKHGRIPYVFDSEKLEATISGDFEEMVMEWLTLDEKAKLDSERADSETKYVALEKEFSEYKAEHSILDSEVDSIKTQAVEEFKIRNDAENKVFASYIDRIGETEEFASLKESASDYSIEALEKECIYIVGKYVMTTKQKNEPKQAEPLKFSLENQEPVEEKPYGGVVEKYSKKKNGGN